MNEQQLEFLQSLEGGDLSAAQAAHLLELGEGDTSAPALETGGVPGTTAGQADAGATIAGEAAQNEGQTAAAAPAAAPEPATAVDGAPAGEIDPANAVILAKDGKHTIGYEKLVEAREAAAIAKAQLELAQQQIATLRAEADARAATGAAPTKVDNQVAAADAAIAAGVDPGIFGDFSEEALAKGIQTLVDARVAAALAPVEAKLVPIQKAQATNALDAHYTAIYEKHPDADSIAESKELADWIASQPSFARAGYQDVLANGNTTQVIELFDTFKAATVKAQPAPAPAPAVDVKAAAQAAIANAAPQVPASLTDFPGGKTGPTSDADALAQISDGADLLSRMQDWSPAQIEAHLNRNI